MCPMESPESRPPAKVFWQALGIFFGGWLLLVLATALVLHFAMDTSLWEVLKNADPQPKPVGPKLP